jgi:5S rRNA maturation endonuclease (ribonuclease M5)
MTFDDFIAKFEKRQKTAVGWLVRCPAHDDSSPSLQVRRAGDGKILLKCFANCPTESVVAALGLKMKDLFPEEPARPFAVPASNAHATTEKPVIEKIYSYQKHTGQEAYQVVRLKPKSFRQRHQVDGNWIWSMDGVERFIYHLPEVLKSPIVWIVEGEKDADNLAELGIVATCNVGGAGKWLDAYTETLCDKEVVICGDTDEPGQKHVDLVFESVCGKAKSVRIVKLPKTTKDISDFIASFKSENESKAAIEELFSNAHPFFKGVKLPIYTMGEIEPNYLRLIQSQAQNSFDLGKWLPTLGRYIRPLIPGELVFFIGDTGAGKTGILSAIAKSARPIPTLLFELELPPELLFERSVAAQYRLDCRDVESAYQRGEVIGEGLGVEFRNFFICTQSRLTLADFENYILRSELKMGCKPKLVLIDYLQLVGADGANRRERISDVAEGLKVLAKTTRTIIIAASQVRRPTEDSKEIALHSAKESGSIENSCGLLIGAWRDKDDSTLMHLKVLKSTKGGSGTRVKCNFDGAKMLITERTTEPV